MRFFSLTGRRANGETKKRELELDFIRGIAILLVLDFHVPNGFLTRPLAWVGLGHIGWMGVNLFFVLSGFLVGGLLMKQWKNHRRIEAGRFLARRAFKIWPQYYVYIGAILLTGHRSWAQMAGNLVHLQNYVGGVPHTWTLAVEEHAYLLLVLCLVVAARARVKPRSLFVFLASVSLLESVLRLILAHYGRNFYFMTHTSLDGILDGVLLALLFHFAPAKFEKLRGNFVVSGCLLVAAVALISVNPQHRISAALRIDGATLFSVALLLLLYRPAATHGVIYRFVAAVGVYSYGIYLWHVSLLAPLAYVYLRLPESVAMTEPAVFMMTAILVGALTTRLIELPALHFRDRFVPPQRYSQEPAVMRPMQGTRDESPGIPSRSNAVLLSHPEC